MAALDATSGDGWTWSSVGSKSFGMYSKGNVGILSILLGRVPTMDSTRSNRCMLAHRPIEKCPAIGGLMAYMKRLTVPNPSQLHVLVTPLPLFCHHDPQLLPVQRSINDMK